MRLFTWIMGMGTMRRGISESVSTQPRDDSEEQGRGKHANQRSQAYIDAVNTYLGLRDAAFPDVTPLMRAMTIALLQSKTAAEIELMSGRIIGALGWGKSDTEIQGFIRELERSELLATIERGKL